MSDEEYPEHAKAMKVESQRQTIEEFLEHLESVGLVLASWTEDDAGRDMLIPLHQSRESLLADYFHIDRTRIEQERREMVDRIRKATGQ